MNANKNNVSRIITHFIAGFPTVESSADIAHGLISAGAFALEMQIPFSDPSADGPVIENACRKALEAGFQVDDAFRLLASLRSESDIPIFLMSYAGIAYVHGIKKFATDAAKAGASGLIVPDLIPGADEGLYKAADAAGCRAVPVIVPGISEERLNAVLAEPIDWIYVALRQGITGTYTEIGEEQENFLGKIRRLGGANGPRIMAGFGIQDAHQVRMVTTIADAAIVGSALVNAIEKADTNAMRTTVKKIIRRLQGP